MGVEKPVRNAVFLLIRNSENPLQVMGVKRLKNDKDFPGLWGLPASNVKHNETFEDAVIRAGIQKLGIELKIKEFIGEGNVERREFILHGREYEVEIVSGIPKVPQDFNGISQYSEFGYFDWPKFIEAAKEGSLCSNLYFKYLGMSPLYRIF